MSAETLSSISNALSTFFAPDLSKQWNRMAVVASHIKAEKGAGKSANWDVEFTGATAATVAEGSDVSSGEFASDINVPAILNWAHYRSSFQISETELDAAASSIGTPEALVDLFGDRVLGSGAKIASKVNKDIWTATGLDGFSNPTVVGLLGGSLDATGTYAGINRATFPEFSGNVLANSGTPRPLTFDLLYQLEQNIFTASGEAPDMIVTSPGVYRKYAGLFESVRRLVTDGMGPLSYEAGADQLYWKGIPVIRDKDASSGFLVMLNTRHIMTKYLPRIQTPNDAVMMNMMGLEGSNGAVNTQMTGVPLRIVALSKTGDSLKFSLKTSIAMLVRRPNSMGYIADIAES